MGGIVLLAAVFQLSEGGAASARVGFVLGGAMVVFSEWSRWRARQ
jgi:hypothetical protein